MPRAATRLRIANINSSVHRSSKIHRYAHGKKIGTTLLAAAVTNFPFLQGMDAIALCAAPMSLGEVAMRRDRSEETAMELVKKGAKPPIETAVFSGRSGPARDVHRRTREGARTHAHGTRGGLHGEGISDDGEFVRLRTADGEDRAGSRPAINWLRLRRPTRRRRHPQPMDQGHAARRAEEQVAQSAPHLP